MDSKVSSDHNLEFLPDSMVTGSWNSSQVTVHVHGQEVLSEETVHLGAEPESPSELQDPTQTSTLEQSHEETNQSPDQGTPEQQSPHCEEEFQPLQEHGGEPKQEEGTVAKYRAGIYTLYRREITEPQKLRRDSPARMPPGWGQACTAMLRVTLGILVSIWIGAL